MRPEDVDAPGLLYSSTGEYPSHRQSLKSLNIATGWLLCIPRRTIAIRTKQPGLPITCTTNCSFGQLSLVDKVSCHSISFFSKNIPTPSGGTLLNAGKNSYK